MSSHLKNHLHKTLHHILIIGLLLSVLIVNNTSAVRAAPTAATIVVGGNHTCVLTDSGGIMCWGDNEYGQLGDGTTIDRNVPTDVIGLTNGIISIAPGINHTCAITAAGGVKCWGDNTYGQLGDGTSVQRLTPVDVVGLTNGVIAIGVGLWHTCALTSAGGVKCWGDDLYDQIGNGTTTPHLTPIDVGGLTDGVMAIAVGYQHTCALNNDGGVKCWGYNDFGQLGRGTADLYGTAEDLRPGDVFGLTSGVIGVSAGYKSTCALTIGHGVKCWGENTYGQLGDDTTTERDTPVDVSGLTDNVSSITVGWRHACALTASGGLKCWGLNVYGELGDESYTERHTPVDVSGLTSGVSIITAGQGHTCALTGGATLQCWGGNWYGELGDGTTTKSNVPVTVAGVQAQARQVLSGNAGVIGVVLRYTGGIVSTDVDGNYSFTVPYGWNGNVTPSKYGYTFVPSSRDYINFIADQMAEDYNAVVTTRLISGNAGVAGVTLSSSVDSTISDADGNYAIDVPYNWSGTVTPSLANYTFSPEHVDYTHVIADQTGQDYVVYPPTGAVTITGGQGHTCAVTVGGGVRCWGANGAGELGDGTTRSRLTPADVVGLNEPVIAIVAGDAHTCALTATGGVKCWGWNAYGQLGDGTTIDRLTPVDVNGLTSGVVAIAASYMETCAVTVNGGLKCWGYNNHGQVGDGTTANRYVPVDVSGLTSGTIAVAVSTMRACAVTAGGGVKCWGFNWHGEVGDGTTTDRYTPVDVIGLSSGVSAIDAGAYHTCVLTTSGGVKCWGANGSGELGDGTTIRRITPVDVSGLTSGISAISSGLDHNCALTVGGGVKCWGWNNYGMVGDGTHYNNRLTPVNVNGLTSGFISINAASYSSCAVTAGGGVKCWGGNNLGQLGDGTTIEQDAPVDVVGLPGGVPRIVNGNVGVPGATINYTCGGIKTTVADNNGDYTFSIPDGWSGTVTPSKFGYIFNPASQNYANVQSDQVGQDYAAQALPLISGNAGAGGVTLSYLDGTSKTTTADIAGNYIIPVSDNWSGSVTPSKPGYIFTPASRDYLDVQSSQTGHNYQANALPTGLNLSSNSLSGNMPVGTVIGTFTTADPDAGETFNYTLVAGTGSDDNASFDIVGNQLKTQQVFDATVKSSYTIRVRTTDSGAGNAYLEETFSIAISSNSYVPILLTPGNSSHLLNNRPTLDWLDVPGAASYTIQVSKDAGFTTMLVNITVTSSTYTPLVDFPAGATLWWRVHRNNAVGPNPWSPTWMFTTAAPPSVPILLMPANNSLVANYTPTFTWKASTLPLNTALDHYEIQVASNIAFSSPVIDANTSGLSYPSGVALDSNTTYYWRVRAYNTNGDFSGWSAVWSLRTALLPPVPVAPANDSSTSIHTTYPTFTWTNPNSSGVTGYTIQISKYANFSLILMTGNPTTTSFTPTTALPGGTVLYWRVQVKGANGPSAWSSPAWALLTGNPPSVPTLLYPTNGSLDTYVNFAPGFNWNASILPTGTALDHYDIQIATDPNFSNQPVYTSATPWFTPTSVLNPVTTPNNTVFYWHVRAWNTDGESSAWSSVWTLKTAYPALSLSNGQAAKSVLGQTNFTSTGLVPSYQIGLYGPMGVAVDPTTGKVFVADTGLNRVTRFASWTALNNGALAEAVLGQPGFVGGAPATTQNGMRAPRSLAIDSNGTLWVADTDNNRVLRFDHASSKATGANADGVLGQSDFITVTTSATQSTMSLPMAVAVDSSGRLWVADYAHGRVLRFDNAANLPNGANANGVLGQPDFTSTVWSISQNSVYRPMGLAVDAIGRLWVTDADNSRVLRFDHAASLANGAAASGVLGQTNFTSSTPGISQNKLHYPTGLTIDFSGRLWVVDQVNNRILGFSNAASLPNGANASIVLGQTNFTSNVSAAGAAGFNTPYGVFYSGFYHALWVADSHNNRVLRFGG